MLTSPKRILLVDNDPHVLHSVPLNLKMAGYQVVTADSAANALTALQQEIIHLAIIDVRLENDDRTTDQSGFDLARQLPPYVPCIIYTAWEDSEIIRQALGPVRAKRILSKRLPDAAAQLVQMVREVFTLDVHVNFGLTIEESLDLVQAAEQIQIPATDSPRPTAEDVRQILQVLFHDRISVHIASLLPPEKPPTRSQSGSLVTRATPLVGSVWGVPVVVKFGARAEIDQEARNYKRILDVLRGSRLAIQKIEPAYSRAIGGVAYLLLDQEDSTDFCTLSEKMFPESPDKIVELLEHFFTKTFPALAKNATTDMLDLTALYTRGLHLTPAKLRDAVREIHPQALTDPQIYFKELSGAYINPILWALPNGQFRPCQMLARKCLCHGDLHSGNILVDEAGKFWLIDFARVEESHALRDFVELEGDIKFRLMPVTDLKALATFERALLAADTFEQIPLRQDYKNERLAQASQIILHLRRLAARHLHGDMREYYWALFFDTLKVLRLDISDEKKQYALLSAALLAQRLQEWPRWNRVTDGSATDPALNLAIPNVVTPTKSVAEPLMDETATMWGRIKGAVVLMTAGSGVIALLALTIRILIPDIQGQIPTLIFFAALTIIVLALVGLIKGDDAVKALLNIIRMFKLPNKEKD